MKNKKIIRIIIILALLTIIVIAGSSFILQKDIFITINGTDTEVINIDSNYSDLSSSACYGYKYLKNKKCVDISRNVKVISNVSTQQEGEYEVNYEYSYRNVVKSKIRKIIVKDTIKPEITLKDAEKLVCGNSTYKEPGYTATDNIDGDITDKVSTRIVDKKVIYEVIDKAGNKANVVRKLEYGDKTPPEITLNGYQETFVLLGSTYQEPGVTVVDNCDGNISKNVKMTGNVDTSKLGTYAITYSVKDSVGNQTTKTRKVKIFEKQALNIVIPTQKTIYLTFDDGPGPYTNQLLDTLKKYNIKATFFVIYRPSYKSVIKRAYNEGHTIALHTASHVYKKIYVSEEAYFTDLNKVSNFVKEITGEESKLIRFPGGSSNTVSSFNKGIMTRLTKEVEYRGYRYFDWTVSSGDTSTSSQTKVENNVINRLGNKNYYVVLQHDIKKHSVLATKRIIEYGLANGYTFAPLSYNSPVVHSRVNN